MKRRCLMLSVLLAVAAAGEDAKREETQPKSETGRREIEGRRVFRDPVTGEIRPPEGSELQRRPTPQLRTAPPVTITLPNGAVGRRTPLREMDFTVVQRKVDGTLDYSCVQGDDAAAKRIESSKKKPAAEGATR